MRVPPTSILSFGSGTDFDRKIVVKPKAPELLREAFEKRSWDGELIMFSGNTDCYQPLEASYRLTRACLEVCAEYQNPVHIITKAPLIERDIDVLSALNAYSSVGVSISIPFWNEAARARHRALRRDAPTPNEDREAPSRCGHPRLGQRGAGHSRALTTKTSATSSKRRATPARTRRR